MTGYKEIRPGVLEETTDPRGTKVDNERLKQIFKCDENELRRDQQQRVAEPASR